MKIVSTNIGEKRTLDYKGKKVETGIFKFSVDHPIFLGSEDVENDHVMDRKYHGGTDKACYLYGANHYEYWKSLYPALDFPSGMFGENLTVDGLNETGINIGDIYKIGEAQIQVTQPRQPCFKLEFRFPDKNIVRKFIDSGYSGVYVRVLSQGMVKAGDEMQLIRKNDSLSIHTIFNMLYTDKVDEKLLEKALNEPLLAESCRKDLIQKWKEIK